MFVCLHELSEDISVGDGTNGWKNRIVSGLISNDIYTCTNKALSASVVFVVLLSGKL